MEWAPHEEMLLARQKRTGEHIPALADKVELHEAEIWIANAWHVLSSRRARDSNNGMPLPITLESIEIYARVWEIEDQESVSELFHCIIDMDLAFCAAVGRQISSKMKSPAKK